MSACSERAIRDALGAHWRLFLFEGAILIILGILAIAAPAVATLAVDIYIGWLFLIAGIVGFFTVFPAREIASFLWSLIPAVLSMAVGALLLWKPAEGALSLTVLLIALFIVEGVFQVVTSIAYRDAIGGSWGVDFGERHRGSGPGRDHHFRLAYHRQLGAGCSRWRKPDHLGLGDCDGRTCRARCRRDPRSLRSNSLI